MENGVVFYYGDGHGKSMAAMGYAMHAVSMGKTATVIQFLKERNETEEQFLEKFEPELKMFRFAKSNSCFENLTEEEKQEETMNLVNGFHYGKKVISTGASDLVVLDEVLGLVDLKVIDIEDVRQMLLARPEDVTVICTGRALDDRIREYADEIYNIHPEK